MTRAAAAVRVWGMVLLAGSSGWAADGPEAKGALIDFAYYHADVGGRYDWSEGAPGLADFGKADHRAGLLRVYVHNPGSEPLAVEAAALDGTPLQELRDGDRHGVIWWRTFPSPVPARGCAEISVRLRYPLKADAVLSVLAAKQTLKVTVPKSPPPFRIETIGWSDEGRRLTIVAQQVPLDPSGRPRPARVEKVFLDGKDVTARARITAPDFFRGVCPVVVELDKGLDAGSFHTYKLAGADGQAAACTLRTLDEFMRLGMYGAGDLEENAKLGINEASHFGALTRGALDRYAQYGLRSAFHIGKTPPPDVIGHPAVHAYLLHDEPDCWDYGAKEWPAPMRIGYHGPDIVRAMRECIAADPAKAVMVTVDLTYKPANYYVYAPIPDIVSPDCYPLPIGKPLSWVRDVVEVCRQAAGPRRVEIIPQVNGEDRSPDMKYPRPPFPREIRIEYLYGLGAGARGFCGYEWYNEGNHHGARGYGDVMDAVGQVFRRFQLVAPLVLQAHPTAIATCADERVWVRTLVCGAEALLLVAVNDDYESLPADFVIRAKRNVEIALPVVPWLSPVRALRVDDGSFSELKLDRKADGTSIVLPRLDTGEVILVCGDGELPSRLTRRYRRLQQEAGMAIARAHQIQQRDTARVEALVRYIRARYAEYAVSASSTPNGYGAESKGLWNPTGEKYNAIEWWSEKTPRGGEWRVDVDEKRAALGHVVYFQREIWWGGGHLRVEVVDAQGRIVMEKDRPTWTGPVPNFTVTFPKSGAYTIRILHAGKGKPGGRLARSIYVVPTTAPPLPAPAW